MRLTPPKQIVFYISLLLAVLALVGYFVDLPRRERERASHDLADATVTAQIGVGHLL